MFNDTRGLKEATGKAEPAQARPVTLFTGQWADLPSNHLNGQAVCEAIIDDRYKTWSALGFGVTVIPRASGSGPPRR